MVKENRMALNINSATQSVDDSLHPLFIDFSGSLDSESVNIHVLILRLTYHRPISISLFVDRGAIHLPGIRVSRDPQLRHSAQLSDRQSTHFKCGNSPSPLYLKFIVLLLRVIPKSDELCW